jgi:ATP-dependent Clp protease ATP-binding subunit ClpA
MAYDIRIPLHIAQLKLSSGASYQFILNDADALQFNESSKNTADKYALKFQENRLNKGRYGAMINEIQQGEFTKNTLTVSFLAAKDRITHPEFSLEFRYFTRAHGQGFLSFIPALGIQSYSNKEEEIEKRAEESVRLEFSRESRLKYVQNIIETIWYEEAEMIKEEVSLSIPTLSEVEEMTIEKSKRLLPEVAKKLEITEQAMFGGVAWINQFGNALRSSFGRSILLVGKSGVGKSTLVREVARRKQEIAYQGDIWETTASVLIKELTKDSGWQDPLASLAKELGQTGDLLFIRNLADLFEVGQYEGNSISMAEYLRGFIGRGEVILISECTFEEAAQIEVRAPGFLSLFQSIRMVEPRGKALEEIITEKIESVSKRQKIDLKKNATKEIIRLHRRFMPYSGFPGKPIRFIESVLLNPKIRKNADETLKLSQKEIIKAFSEESGMPMFMIDPAAKMDTQKIESDFNRQVFGQENAVNAITNMLATVKTALSRTNKPIASFLFVGPTGVGKTELGKVLAQFMFGKRDRLLRFDMSEYSNPYEVSRLIGVGNADGLLTSGVRRQPFSVVLFDEIEKAAKNFFDLLLQVLSEGRLTDGRGKTVNFCSTIIIMTSNIGAANLQTKGIGWNSKKSTSDISDHFVTAAEKYFRPELFNRIDRIVPFAPLSSETVRFILNREIALLNKREGLSHRTIDLEITEEAKEYLAKKGYDEKYGARQLQRAIHEELVTPLSKKVNEFPWDEKLVVKCDVSDNQLVINLDNDPLGLELLLEELEKVNNADLAGELRYNLDSLNDSFTWLEFTDLLMRRKEEEKAAAEKGEVLPASEISKLLMLREIEQKAKQLRVDIEEIEMEIGLVCLNLRPYAPKINDTIAEWQAAYNKVQIELLSALSPERNMCTLAIYGAGDKLLELKEEYEYIFNVFGIKYSTYLVWFRADYYNELIPQKNNDETELAPRESYLYTKFSDKKDKPLQKDDLLRGIEFKLKSPLVYWIFKKENGLQHRIEGDEIEKFMVLVNEGGMAQTPTDIHRNSFYKGSPRRIISTTHFKDTVYKLERETKEILDLLVSALEQNFGNEVAENI